MSEYEPVKDQVNDDVFSSAWDQGADAPHVWSRLESPVLDQVIIPVWVAMQQYLAHYSNSTTKELT